MTGCLATRSGWLAIRLAAPIVLLDDDRGVWMFTYTNTVSQPRLTGKFGKGDGQQAVEGREQAKSHVGRLTTDHDDDY
jgi:hypothetical protein